MPPRNQSPPTCRQDEVLRELKKSGPLQVRELAARLTLSYMGTKQHCLTLEKRGLLTSRNAHQSAGRPLLIYALTRKGQAWFEDTNDAVAISILRNAQKLFGPSSAAKLLLLYFQEAIEKYRTQIPTQATIEEKMNLFARIRDEEGRMTELVPGHQIIERHNPNLTLHKAFPEADALEESLVRQILGSPVRRRVTSLGDQYEIHFELHRTFQPET